MNPSKSRHACRHCRTLKRKCDRSMPSCSLCIRLSKHCEYGASVTSRSPASDPAISTPSTSPTSTSTQFCTTDITTKSFVLVKPEQQFPLQYVLDNKSFTPIQACNAFDSTPQHLLNAIVSEFVSAREREALFEAYRSSIHEWLPMISPRRLGNSFIEPEACLDVLVLCMKLCTTPLAPETRPNESSLYITARALCAAAETAGIVSLRLVQSLILVTVYEMANAIYPAAYLTIGRAARLVDLIGWNRQEAPQLFRSADTMRLREEQRRAWWAIFVLDRFINAGSDLPFALAEPSHDELLPVNDADWNESRVAPSVPLYTASVSPVVALGPFARSCQAAHMLSRVMCHKQAKSRPSQDVAALLEEALGLHQALAALQLSIQQQSTRGSGVSSQQYPEASLSICITARYILYNLYGCPDVLNSKSDHLARETEMQSLSIQELLHLTTKTVPDLARASVDCPLWARCFYAAAKVCGWIVREDYDPAVRVILSGNIAALRDLGSRWRVASEFNRLLADDGTIALAAAAVGG